MRLQYMCVVNTYVGMDWVIELSPCTVNCSNTTTIEYLFDAPPCIIIIIIIIRLGTGLKVAGKRRGNRGNYYTATQFWMFQVHPSACDYWLVIYLYNIFVYNIHIMYEYLVFNMSSTTNEMLVMYLPTYNDYKIKRI